MVKKDLAYSAFSVYQTQIATSNRWILANQVLYDFCKEHPMHGNCDEIVAKIWLIGRSYAAALERSKDKINYSGDFYYDYVAPKILSIGTYLDQGISKLSTMPLDFNSLPQLLDVHGLLMKAFKELTGMSKRSLASKYLHFHCPDKVFILDSIANRSLCHIVKPEKDESKYIIGDRDPVYADFCYRALALHGYVRTTFNINLTPRQLDGLLYT